MKEETITCGKNMSTVEVTVEPVWDVEADTLAFMEKFKKTFKALEDK